MKNLKIFINGLNQKLEKRITKINKEENPINNLQLKTEYYYDIILQLKSFIQDYPFTDINEEIRFFKEIKPSFTSEYLYNKQKLQILINKPLGNLDDEIGYYENKLKDITCFFNANQEFYKYLRLNLTYNDPVYFVRQKKELIHLTDNNSLNFEPAFSSSHDQLVAQIIANDLLENHLKEEIKLITNQNKFPHVEYMGKSYNKKLEWTDSRTNLVELIYALNYSGCINYGNSDIRKLTKFFEHMFNIKLPDIYRTFQDIKMRNSPVKFIDNLKVSLQKKINEDYQ